MAEQSTNSSFIVAIEGFLQYMSTVAIGRQLHDTTPAP